MWNERLPQRTSLASTGMDTCVQFGWPAGQVTPGTVNAGLRLGVCVCVSNPAGWKFDIVIGWLHPVGLTGSGVQPGGGMLLFAAPSVSNSTPAEAVESLSTTVLFLKSTFTASWIDAPPPAQPATLFAMMLLVTEIAYQCVGSLGLFRMSLPLASSIRKPPPLPLSAVLPMIRLASMVTGPVPSDNAGATSMSMSEFSLAVPSGLAPWTTSPPPHVGIVGLLLWLNRNELCAMTPLKLSP